MLKQKASTKRARASKNPIEWRPTFGRQDVIAKSGGVVGSRTRLTPPEIPEVGFDAVPAYKKTDRNPHPLVTKRGRREG